MGMHQNICSNLFIIWTTAKASKIGQRLFNLTLDLRRDCCNPQRFLTAFLPNELRQTFQVNHFNILYASFDVYRVKLGGVVINENGRVELVKSHDFYVAHFLNIWQDMCFELAMLMGIIISLHIQQRILRKSHVPTIFSEKLIFANFHAYFQCIQIYESTLILWRHSDII